MATNMEHFKLGTVTLARPRKTFMLNYLQLSTEHYLSVTITKDPFNKWMGSCDFVIKFYWKKNVCAVTGRWMFLVNLCSKNYCVSFTVNAALRHILSPDWFVFDWTLLHKKSSILHSPRSYPVTCIIPNSMRLERLDRFDVSGFFTFTVLDIF